ncbi:uncharacterized protein LOC126284588 [Schistocerca gregaria]|uniref:uncharacterized protein LOC126284588 n=1 Tax=Schistocerca gregaria TaxID=7010 RepID=UPI00211E4B1B|nr:uncharacterized protein LOC126284588 [Schistocerca gregaria]
MGDSPTENSMRYDIITNWKTETEWAPESKDDVSVFTDGIGEGVESDIPDNEEIEQVDCRTTASDDDLTFIKNSYCNTEETSSPKVTAPLTAYAKFADVVLHSGRTGEDSLSDAVQAGVSGQRENEGRGKLAERQLKKGLIQSILSTLSNKRRFQRTVPPPPTHEEPTVSPGASGSSRGSRSLLRALHLFSLSWRTGPNRAEEHSPTQIPTARSDTSATQRSVAMIEKVGSRLRTMQQLLQAHSTKGGDDEEVVFQKVVTEVRSQLSDAETMIAEIAPLVGKKSSKPDLHGTLEMMTKKLLELRDVLQIGPAYSGSFSQLDVQAAFIDARNRLKEAQSAASKLGPIIANADKYSW